MIITKELLQIVERTHSLSQILDAATELIAERLHADTCHAFLLDERQRLIRHVDASARSHVPSESDAAEAELIAARAIAERRVVVVHSDVTSFVASPMLLRDARVGALVLQSNERPQATAEEISALHTICAQLVGIVEDARIIDALDRGERPLPRTQPRPTSSIPDRSERVLHGVAASPGVAIGVAIFRGAHGLDLSSEPAARDPEVERVRVRGAIDKARNDLLAIQSAAAREIDEEHALIFGAHLLLLNDPMLLQRIDEEVARGLSAPMAIDAALTEFEARLRLVPDAYIQERIDDIDDLRGRMLDHAFDGGTRERFAARIVLTSRVPPSLVVELKTEAALALVTELGGATSHGVLLARAMGIPAVTGVADLLGAVRLDEQLIVDGTNGVVIVRPTEATVARYTEERQRDEHRRTEYAKYRDVLACTADGVRVTLHANVGVASDLTSARENGAEGVGLYRTEFPFIVRDAFPTRLEQVKIYRKAYELFTGPINFRILDLAGDKFVAGGAIAAARNAFHGYRSIRVLFDYPDVLKDQVQALAIAAGERPLRILIPMVSSIEELRRVRALIEEALTGIEEPHAQRAPLVGAMIEVPAAVELAADIANEVDFLSIGTNDLMQYTLVVDREDSRMAAMIDPYHPAILRMIGRVAASARAAKTPVGVCGEIAARPEMALAMVALGIDSLSVVPGAIASLKQSFAGARLESMRGAMPEILALSEARLVAAALREAYAG